MAMVVRESAAYLEGGVEAVIRGMRRVMDGSADSDQIGRMGDYLHALEFVLARYQGKGAEDGDQGDEQRRDRGQELDAGLHPTEIGLARRRA